MARAQQISPASRSAQLLADGNFATDIGTVNLEHGLGQIDPRLR